MKKKANDGQGKTALRHGNKDTWVQHLSNLGFEPKILEISKKESDSLLAGDRYYGEIILNSRILLIDRVDQKATYWEIMV